MNILTTFLGSLAILACCIVIVSARDDEALIESLSDDFGRQSEQSISNMATLNAMLSRKKRHIGGLEEFPKMVIKSLTRNKRSNLGFRHGPSATSWNGPSDSSASRNYGHNYNHY